MALTPLTDLYIDETYQRLVQTNDARTEFADGLGQSISFGQTPTGSLLLTASVLLNTITFIKGDGSTFPITVDTGSGGIVSGDYVTTSSFNAFTQSINTATSSFVTTSQTSSFITTSSFNTFTSSYNTGSFTGSFNGVLNGTASQAATSSNILGGKATHIPFFKTDTTLATSSIYQSGSNSIIINQDVNTTSNPEALYVYQPHPTSFNVISGIGSLNNYLQLNIKNNSVGTTSSADIVATADNGDENSNYIDMGINGSNFTGSLGKPNDAYLYSAGNDLHIGNITAGKPIQFFAGGLDVEVNKKLQLSPNNSHQMTGSLDISGSLNVRNNLTSSGLLTNGNNNILGNTTMSGSSTIIGTTTMTGSLLITGSTTQTGNNTLIGNTLLSGSITISGSSTPGSPTASVQIYGDIRQSGYHRFDPVTTNIDTSVSASYIYVSGSTQDMYFSQNGSGKNNVTRLRWLEGGALYTGLLRGGVISSTPGTTTFNITSGSGLLVTMNASTASEPFPTVQYISWPDYNAQPIINSGSAKITYVGIDNNGQIIQQTVPWGTNDINQWDNSLSLGVVLHLSGSVSTGVFNAPQISYGGFQKTDDFFRAFGPLKVSGHTLQASGSTLSLTKLAGASYREGANYVINPNHPSTVIENSINVSKIYRYYLSGSTPVIDTGVANAGYTVINPTQRVNTTTGALTGVSTNKYSLQRVFWVPNSPTNAFIVYYGNAEYNSLIDAVNAKDSEPFTEAPNTSQNAIFLGYIAVAGGAASLTNASDATIVQGGLFRSVGGVGSGGGTNFVSTTLAGLSDVTLTSPSNNQLLAYNSGTSKWNNVSNITASLHGTASWAEYVVNGSGGPVFPYTGNAVITGSLLVSGSSGGFSGITGSLEGTSSWAYSSSQAISSSVATSSSYATTAQNVLGSVTTADTASYANNFTIAGQLTLDATLTDYNLKASTSAGPTNTFFLQPTGSFTSAFCKYTAYNGANSRAGEFVTSWNGTTVSYYDNATVDIGSTANVTFTSQINAGNIEINTGVLMPSGWTIKMLAIFM
jgi:hypothetical protein